MVCCNSTRAARRVLRLFCLLIPLLSLPHVLSAGNAPPRPRLGFKVEPERFATTASFGQPKKATFCLGGYIPAARPSLINTIQRQVELESTSSFVMVRETILNEDLNLPRAFTFEQYQEFQHRQERQEFWRKQIVQRFTDRAENARGLGGINLDIPVKIRSEAFQKIFGGSTVGLSVTGDIRIEASIRREDRSQVRTAITRGANTNFRMEQQQRFTVTGKIGDKVKVNVDQDSERAFDFDNNVRLHYEGYEDEIIRSIQAGNISLSLPGTRYVTFSGKNTGLFGVKTEMTLGNLNITSIASQEKGESQRLSLTGGATENTQEIRDTRYLKQVYFFLDSLYREQYRFFDADGNHVFDPNIAIIQDSIEVYKAAAGFQNEFSSEAIPGWAIYNYPTDRPIQPSDTASVKSGEVENGFFVRMEKSEYHVENNLGFIRFNQRVADDEIIAVAYKRANGEVIGDLNYSRGDTTETRPIILKLIKSRNLIPSHATWELAWKHVYSLGGRNIEEEGLEISMFYEPASNLPQEVDENGRFWLNVFGLDSRDQSGNPAPTGDGNIDRNSNILNLALGELHFPDLQPFDPEGYFVEQPDGSFEEVVELPTEFRSPAIYDTTDASVINASSKFFLKVKSKNRSASYNLGFNVIEGSEIVTLNGQVLRKDVDYTIDYFSGTLTILDERASSPSANVDITYERNQLFQLEKKTILGTRAEYNLGPDSFIGGTFLYLNETTLDQKVRVGRGPMRNLVWDINGRLRFQPNFISRALDALPIIRASGETQLNFEGEIAQVSPTPNTLNSSRTGDNQGVAYIDDFEGAKKTTSFGVLRRSWTRASEPGILENNFKAYPARKGMNFIWYNPFEQVSLREIYPERDLNPNVPNLTHVLNLRFFPNPQDLDPRRWGGVMRALSPGFFDQTQSRFLEVMVRGNVGRLHIDMGLISEDVIPNNRLDTEDRRVSGIRNGVLDDGEDIGIDGMAKPDPPELNFPIDHPDFVGKPIDEVPYDFWDVNANGVKDADEPWSYDDWFYTESSPFTYITPGTGAISGDENNANDEVGRIPDTEDINGNGSVDLANSYFEYAFSLHDDHPDAELVVGGNPEAGWKLYRIPLDEFIRKVGQLNLTQIEFVRIWVDSITTSEPVEISIADLSLVGNEWKELGVTADDHQLSTGLDRESDELAISVINTHENPGYSETLEQIGVQGEEDRITGVRAREQSMVIRARNLTPGYSGVAQKSLFQGENYIHYHRIRMFVYGQDYAGTHISTDSSAVEYFIRFGADIENYYEYRAPVYPGWDERNHLDLSLQELTNLKVDSSFYDPATGITTRQLEDGRSLAVKGRPSLTNIKTLIIGVRNRHPSRSFDGELWFNELRLSDVQRDKGMAMRFRGDMKIADFASVNAEIERKDADFHNVATRFGSGDNQVSSSFNASLNIDKMLPQSWGLSVPFSFNYRQSHSTPKYFPGQDRLVTDDTEGEQLELVRSQNTQSGFSLSFRRQQKSDNFFLKHTVDNISFGLGYSSSHSENPNVKFSDRTSWRGNLSYTLNFGRNNFFSPLKWLPDLPLLDLIKETRLYYTPQTIGLQADGAKTDQETLNRIQNSARVGKVNTNQTFTVNRSVRTNFKVFESLSLDLTRSHTTDLRGVGLNALISGGAPDINVNQNFSARYTPKIVDWLNNSFTYSANYRFNNNVEQPTTGKNAGVNTNKSAQLTLRLREFARSVFGVGKESTPSRGRRPPGQRPGETQEEEEQEEEGGISLNPLKLLGGLISRLKDISFNYSERQNINQYGLADANPSLAFQFGLSDTTNVATVADLSTNSLTSSDNRSYSLTSGLGFGRSVDISLRFQHSDLRSRTTNVTGNRSDSWMRLGNFDMPFPEWTVTFTGFDRFPFVKKLFNNLSFSHSFSGKRDITWSGSPDNVTQETISTNFRPLGKLDFRFKNGLGGNVQFNKSRTLSLSLAGGVGARRTTNTDLSVTASYSKRSGFKLPIWPFNKAELKNNIDFNFSFIASSTVTEQRIGQNAETAKFEEQEKLSRWSFRPSMTYSFSNQVRGGAFLEVGRTNSKRTGSTSIQEFGFTVNIAIRGN